MKWAAVATLLALAIPAHAEPSKSAPPPDEIADIESREANLEPTEPRKGLTFAGAVGGGIFLGGDIGVGRGPALSLRIGHVATRKTVITFELTGSSGLHKESLDGDVVADNNFGLLAGAQRYTSGSLWVRGAGGFTVFVEDVMTNGSGGKTPRGGIGGLAGAGFDIARWGYLVLGFETFGLASVSRDGFKLQLAFSLGLSHY